MSVQSYQTTRKKKMKSCNKKADGNYKKQRANKTNQPKNEDVKQFDLTVCTDWSCHKSI